MNETRNMQNKVLKLFSEKPGSFGLAGGTALELYYLHHRFSKDLDFFSAKYDTGEIEAIVAVIGRTPKTSIKLERELILDSHAKMRVYIIQENDSGYPLKIDFVEDVIVNKPGIKKYKGIPVYRGEDIYFHKIATLVGSGMVKNPIGREITSGRNEIRDIIDVYYLSQKIEPLHLYLKKLPKEYQRRMIQWYHTYSRQDFKIGFLDYEVYDRQISSRTIVLHLDDEIKKYISGELE